MAWTAPFTAVPNTALTAAQWNQQVRDNFLETAPAKATSAGGFIVANGANSVILRKPGFASAAAEVTTTSTTYTTLGSSTPQVTATTGTSAILFLTARILLGTAGEFAIMSVQVSGATTIAASDDNGLWHDANTTTDYQRASVCVYFNGTLNAGSNTFTANYRVSGGATGARFVMREILVVPSS